jgi:hypothetical protein
VDVYTREIVENLVAQRVSADERTEPLKLVAPSAPGL